MSDSVSPTGLAKKLVAAMKDIDAVGKQGKNEKQGYGYVRAVDVAKEVRPVLIHHGIGFTYSVLSSERWERVNPTTGSILYFVELNVLLTFIDQDTGESISVNGLGWGMDSGDKAPYKAMTGALKYGLRTTFIIPDESDPENDKNGVHKVEPAADGEPLWDENGELVPSKASVQPTPPAQRSDVPLISKKQAALIFAVGNQTHGRKGLEAYLKDNGWSRTDDIPASKFNAAKEWAGVSDRPR